MAAQPITKYRETDVMPARENSLFQKLPSAVMDMSIAAWPSMEPATPFSAWVRAVSTILATHPHSESEGDEHDDERAADELRQRELPAHHERQNEPELEQQVRGGDLERHRGSEVGARTNQRQCESTPLRGRRPRGSTTRTQRRGQLRWSGSGGVIMHEGNDSFLENDCLDHPWQGESEHEWPEDLPCHGARDG